MPMLQSVFGDYAMIVLSANIMAIVVIITVGWLAHRLGDDRKARAVNYLLCVLGALLGWVIGILATPLTDPEAERFVTLGQAISAFITGYLISKADRFFESAMYNEKRLAADAWKRLGLFSAALLIMLIAVFINRSYLHANVKSQADTQSTAAAPVPAGIVLKLTRSVEDR